MKTMKQSVQRAPPLGAKPFTSVGLIKSHKQQKISKSSSHQTLPKVVQKEKNLFQANHQMWMGQTTSSFSRQNLRTPSFNQGIHEKNFGFFSIRASSQLGKGSLRPAKNSCFEVEANCTRGFNPKNSHLFTQTDENATLQVLEKEAKKIKKEKIAWKHEQDEELRQKLYTNLRDKLQQPLPVPELYDEELAVREKEEVDRATVRSRKGQRMRLKLERAHEEKYAKYWQTSHAAKLSNLKKYDLGEARLKYVEKSPQNLLIFNGKMLEWLKGNQIQQQQSKLTLSS